MAAAGLQDQDVVFFETAVRLDDARSHAVIEAVPLPAKAFSKAPLYFKKVPPPTPPPPHLPHTPRPRSRSLPSHIPECHPAAALTVRGPLFSAIPADVLP